MPAIHAPSQISSSGLLSRMDLRNMKTQEVRA